MYVRAIWIVFGVTSEGRQAPKLASRVHRPDLHHIATAASQHIAKLVQRHRMHIVVVRSQDMNQQPQRKKLLKTLTNQSVGSSWCLSIHQKCMVLSSEQLASKVGLVGLNATTFTWVLHDLQHVNTHWNLLKIYNFSNEISIEYNAMFLLESVATRFASPQHAKFWNLSKVTGEGADLCPDTVNRQSKEPVVSTDQILKLA